MKKLLLLSIIILSGTTAFAFYDFCESPQEYNTFPASYDFKTEYWKDIPKYNTDKIEYKNIKNEHHTDRTIIKQSPKTQKNYDQTK
ncbi:MAG: hypothetical protein NC200_03835 [Candidatus Gastranaerophilales bacterium]|nr:hypothetical protein [Candidatus Gastranaerophilales bacterium]